MRMEGWEGEEVEGIGRGRGRKVREGREREGSARLGYLSRVPRVPSYATGIKLWRGGWSIIINVLVQSAFIVEMHIW